MLWKDMTVKVTLRDNPDRVGCNHRSNEAFSSDKDRDNVFSIEVAVESFKDGTEAFSYDEWRERREEGKKNETLAKRGAAKVKKAAAKARLKKRFGGRAIA